MPMGWLGWWCRLAPILEKMPSVTLLYGSDVITSADGALCVEQHDRPLPAGSIKSGSSNRNSFAPSLLTEAAVGAAVAAAVPACVVVVSGLRDCHVSVPAENVDWFTSRWVGYDGSGGGVATAENHWFGGLHCPPTCCWCRNCACPKWGRQEFCGRRCAWE